MKTPCKVFIQQMALDALSTHLRHYVDYLSFVCSFGESAAAAAAFEREARLAERRRPGARRLPRMRVLLQRFALPNFACGVDLLFQLSLVTGASPWHKLAPMFKVGLRMNMVSTSRHPQDRGPNRSAPPRGTTGPP